MQGPDNIFQVILALMGLIVIAGGILAVGQYIRKRIHRRIGVGPKSYSEEE